MSNPSTVGKGVRNSIFAISYTHGNSQLPLIQDLKVNPKFSGQSEMEFGTKFPVLTSSVYEGGDVSFSTIVTDVLTLWTVLFDVNPANANTYMDFSLTPGTPIALYYNETHQLTGRIVNSGSLSQCRLLDASHSETIKDNFKVNFKFVFAQFIPSPGAALGYTRGVGAAPAFFTSTNVPFGASSNNVLTTNANIFIPQPGTGTTNQTFSLVQKNGVPLQTGFTVSSNVFTLTGANAPAASTDVWDILTWFQG